MMERRLQEEKESGKQTEAAGHPGAESLSVSTTNLWDQLFFIGRGCPAP